MTTTGAGRQTHQGHVVEPETLSIVNHLDPIAKDLRPGGAFRSSRHWARRVRTHCGNGNHRAGSGDHKVMSIPLPRPYRPILGALTMASVLSVAPVACGETAADDTTADDTAATTSTPETTGTDGADEHDTDQSTADEHDTDHGDGDDAGEHPAGNGSTVHGLGDLDVELLHDLDDQLAAGALDAEAQRAVVAELMEAVEALEPSDGSEEAELLDLVRQLDEALAAADLEAAAPLATEAHELAHELQHGEHG